MIKELPILLTEEEVAEKINCSKQTLRNDRSLGRGLPYVKFGRMVRYDLADVIAWLESHKIYPQKG